MKNYKVYPNVTIGEGAVIGDYVLIGVPPRGKKEGELKTVIGKNAVIRSHSVIYAGNKIGDNFETGHYAFLREENVVGNNVRIGTSSAVQHCVRIEDNVSMHTGVFVPEYSILEEGCWLGPRVVLTNTPHPVCPRAKECLKKGCKVGRFAQVGANATLLPHISIGEYSLIGAGSVVTKDIPAKKVAAGNPAKIIKEVGDLRCRYDEAFSPY
ncbi:acyltransferase [Candidatus Omnitrophota bacterium]